MAPGDRRSRQREPAGVQRDQRELETLAFAPEHVLRRHLHVGEPDDPVLQRLESHEVEPLHHLDAGPVRLDDERRDLLRTGARHDHHQLGDGAVGAPELLAVQDVVLAVGRKRRGRAERGGIGADLILGQREGGHGTLGQTRQILLLLRRRAEQLERRGNADGLRRGEQGGEVSVLARDQPHGVGVAVLAQAEAAVLGRDLDAEGADLSQTLHDLGRDLPLAIDLVAVHPLLHEALELLHERPGPGEIRRVGLGKGMHQIEPERTLEQLSHEAG